MSEKCEKLPYQKPQMVEYTVKLQAVLIGPTSSGSIDVEEDL